MAFRISDSQMKLYQQCPEKWFKTYTEDYKFVSSPALEFGRDLHNVLAWCVKNSGESIDTAFAKYNLNFEYGSVENGDYAAWAESFVFSMVNNALNEVLPRIAKLVSVEAKMRYMKLITGTLDLVFIDHNGETWIVDWKTTSNDTYHYDKDELLLPNGEVSPPIKVKVQSNEQLTGYSYLYHEKTGVWPDHLAIITMNTRSSEVQVYKTNRTPEQVDEWRKKVDAIYNQIWVTQTRYKNSASCYDYYSRCPFYADCWYDGNKRKAQF